MVDLISEVRSGYDRWAAVYDHDVNPLIGLEGPVVRKAVGNVRELAVLDLGCGTGRHALWLAEMGARVTAVDMSSGMLDKARCKPGAREVEFIVHDLHEPLPFDNGRFDLVLSGLVLEHLQDLNGFFSETYRVLKVGGRAILSAMHPAMFLRGAQARFTDPTSGAIVQPGSKAHSMAEFVMAATRAGFGLTNVEEFSPDAEFAVKYPRAEKYVGWPMLVVMQLSK